MPTRIDPNASVLDLSEQVEVTKRELDIAIDDYERISKRRTPGSTGEEQEQDAATFNAASNDGFWKHDEYLKCVRGVRMESDERGLPRGYGIGPTWDRARESRQ